MAEGEIEINGGIVVYEFVGPDDGEVVVITPGGRFSKDYGGVHEMANALADGGKRVLLWDRPNCGRSDIQVYGRSESHMRAETLGLLVQELGIERLVATGGSGGARDMIIFTIMWPDLVRKLAVWSIVGGTFSTMLLATAYVLDELRTVRSQGHRGCPRDGRQPVQLGGDDPAEPAQPRPFARVRDRRVRSGDEPLARRVRPEAQRSDPGRARLGVRDHRLPDADRPRRRDRTTTTRSGPASRCTRSSEGSRLIEPPWPEDAWEQAVVATNEGRGSLFDPWVLAVPTLLEFIDEP